LKRRDTLELLNNLGKENPNLSFNLRLSP